jgi:hypothetical protein
MAWKLDNFYSLKDRGQSAARIKQLVFIIRMLQSSNGPFTSLEVLKTSLLRKKQEGA